MTRIFKLNNGLTMPAVGLGTWRSTVGVVAAVVQTALDAGYKHIDCASVYDNEEEIGKVFGSPSFKRDEIFITSKLWNDSHHRVEEALNDTLRDLQLESLDLYLMHWPVHKNAAGVNLISIADIKRTWLKMEDMVRQKKCRSIGVSNFNIAHMKDLLSYATILPVTNQVELHPYLPQNELKEFCESHGIILTAYSPLGSVPREGEKAILNDELVKSIAQRNGKSPATVVISWAVQRGTAPIPKSSNSERIVANLETFTLNSEDFEALNKLHLTTSIRYVNPNQAFKVEVYESKADV